MTFSLIARLDRSVLATGDEAGRDNTRPSPSRYDLARAGSRSGPASENQPAKAAKGNAEALPNLKRSQMGWVKPPEWVKRSSKGTILD